MTDYKNRQKSLVSALQLMSISRGIKLATKSMGHFDTFAFFRNLEEIASFTPFLIFIILPF